MNSFFFLFYIIVFCSLCFKNIFGKRREKLIGRGGLRPSDKTRGGKLNLDYNKNGGKRLSDIRNINKLLIVFDNECTNDRNEIEQILLSIESIYPCLDEDLINHNSIIYELTDIDGNTEYHAYLTINDIDSNIDDDDDDNSINSCIDNTEIYYQDYCIEYIFYEPLSEFQFSDMEYINDIDTNNLWHLDAFDGINNLDNKFCYIKPSSSYNTDPNVDIYILDSPIVSTHNEFNGVNIVNLDKLDRNNGPTPNLHGTAVASVAVGKTVGILRGLRTSITLYQYPITYNYKELHMQDIEDAFNAVIHNLKSTNRRGVINMSNGQFQVTLEDDYPGKNEEWFENFYTTYGDNIIAEGGIIVAAAGNNNNKDGRNPCNIYPAKFNNFITVGNANKGINRYWESNYGECVDVYLPGSRIKMATNTGINDYITDDGTSISAPYLTGIITQMLAINNDLTFDQIMNIITKPQNNIMLGNCPTNDCNLLQFKSCKDFYYQSWRPSYNYVGVCNYNEFEQFTWYEANQYCEIEYGTTLASVHSDEEDELFKESRENSNYGSWTGLQNINGNFEWIDGSVYDYKLNWRINNPKYPSNENCIQMFSSGWGLDTYGDVKCSTHQRQCFVCWEKTK